MRTIRPGNPPPKYPWLGTWECASCKAQVEFQEGDQFDRDIAYKDDQRDGAWVEAHCPWDGERTSWYRCTPGGPTHG